MNSDTFALALTVGAALLALWIHVRFPRLAPEGIARLALHLVLAFTLLELVPAADSVVRAFVILFAAMLPGLVYAFLVSLWVLRRAQSALGAAR